ncbi:hypothetical protein BPAE_0050g00540 [Botrytis paeoniae]|uniref:Uncharacterized protein n=1 Tax=Botrytis paeoniae TaxID=278948 RepID=A0A4Z1FR40_9HELO|nr:hypothetical protein BPAE_0050g00540 [Botrytis paeoniae]
MCGLIQMNRGFARCTGRAVSGSPLSVDNEATTIVKAGRVVRKYLKKTSKVVIVKRKGKRAKNYSHIASNTKNANNLSYQAVGSHHSSLRNLDGPLSEIPTIKYGVKVEVTSFVTTPSKKWRRENGSRSEGKGRGLKRQKCKPARGMSAQQ